MKEKAKKGMNVTQVKLKEYKSDEVGLLMQVVLIELLLIFSIISLLTDIFMPVFYAILAMIMFVMAYNNYKIYKKKYMTPIYIIVGLFVLVTTIMEYMI